MEDRSIMGKIIAIMNEKGGVGKTTTTLECGFQSCNNPKIFNPNMSCLIVDLDAQANATKMLTGQEHIPSVFDLLVSGTDIFSLLKPTAKEWGKIICLPADRRLNEIEPHLVSKLNKETVLKRALSKVKDMFDLILIDLPPSISLLMINAFVAADAYLIPSDTSQYSKEGIKMVKRVADELIETGNNPSLEFLGIVLTSFQKGNSLAIKSLIEELGEEYKDKLLETRIPDSVKVMESQSKKIPVGALDSECSVSVAYRELSKSIFSKKEIQI